MTTREARGLTAAEAEEESIAAYLQRNPDFFERHQAVLARLRLPQARDSQREFLFGPEGVEMASVALVPLGDKGSVGLLALGSADHERFHPAMSTEFLARMAELIAASLSGTER